MPLEQPQIGIGHVWHRRARPTAHGFVHRGYFLRLPMRSLRRDAGALRRNRFGLMSFHDADHGEGGADALAWFEGVLAREGVCDADGEIWLHTFPRVLGYVFKPVSFWYAHRADGSLAAVLAEVNNTFGERHCYLLDGPGLQWGEPIEARKVFHVSPFCAVSGRYRFRFVAPGDVRIELIDDDGVLLTTGVKGRLAALTPERVRAAFFGVPLMTLSVIGLIHWHALRLAVKRVPFFRKPPEPERFVTR